MNTYLRWGIVVLVLAIVSGSWFYFDHRYNDLTPLSAPSEASLPTLQALTPTAPAESAATTNNNVNFMHTVTIETNFGPIVFETYDADAPKTVANFITLADKGFYNGLIFHRVIQGFMIQGGDPTGTGMGGPGYKFADELNPNTPSFEAGYVRGTVAMANAGPNTNGSQFFIMQKDTPLPHNYTIFGKVVSGMDTVDAIAATPVDGNDRPLSPVTMEKVTVAKTQ